MRNVHFDVLVVGAGPAGLSAAVLAARFGGRVGLIDDNPSPGGQIWRRCTRQAMPRTAARLMARLRAGNVSVLTGTRVVAPWGDDALIAETASETLTARYRCLILAPGARELFLPFPGWTLPGVMGAGGLQALVKGGLPIAGKRVVVAGSGPLLLAVGAYLSDHGARVLTIAEQAPWRQLAAFARPLVHDPTKLWQAGRLGWSLRGTPVHADAWVERAHGVDHLEAVTLRQRGRTRTLACDYLACGFGLVPNLELPLAFGCAVRDGVVWVDRWQRTSRAGVSCAGEATGVGGLELSLLEGQIAGLTAAAPMRTHAVQAEGEALLRRRARARRFAAALERCFAPRDELRALPTDDTVVCRCEDVVFGAVWYDTDGRDAKLQTRCGMGPCQGRVCGAALTFLCGWSPDTVRPPVTNARIGSLAEIGTGSS